MPSFVEGSVSPGYESVKELFEANVTAGVEDNAQLCVYVDGVRIRGFFFVQERCRRNKNARILFSVII